MATLAQVREGLRARLATLSGINAFAHEPAAIPTPAAYVWPRRVAFHQDFAGANTYTLSVVVVVSGGDTTDLQRALDGYLAPSGTASVKAALEGDQTLGGVAAAVTVTGIDDYFWREVGGQAQLLFGVLAVEVFA